MKARWPWAVAGALLGSATALVAFAPAAWVASALASVTGGQLQLADARGTVWRGSAVLVLSGGADSRSATALPGRLSWRLRWRGTEFELRARQPCCLVDELRLRLAAGIGRTSVQLLPTTSVAGATIAPAAMPIAHWPAAWLTGLGAPWNTLQLGGTVRLASPGLTIESAQGRLSFAGRAEVQLDGVSSRMSTLDTLGDYRLVIDGQPQGGGTAQLQLATIKGPLLLSGNGQWGGGSGGALRFRGQARAESGSEAALNNLLNVMGRREGAVAVLSIG